ncbi:fumarylacetoacetate hydrolase family protein [Cupriavidus basilensis]|uniref:fumarylacetoacetate hydrolase family protein n=1 Tax=Cupriavidus basilensis TaxID=68895 RepID=UPI00157B143F|nr:fumarylacetoacetate hydrolase family protein [Cupriavidus basilensis]NUA26913.1 fumarylacetoacetate hydrolase family protein [Cupriavidus basilensis]
MKLVSFELGGVASFGAVTEGGLVDLREALQRRYIDLKELLSSNALSEARQAIEGRIVDVRADRLDEVRWLPVVPNPGKIWCIGLNYAEHARETGHEVPQAPVVFLRSQDSQIGHDQAIVRPMESMQLDFEGEIAIIIGTTGRRVPERSAWDHIAGYACYQDASVRDWQRHSAQWTPGKNFWRTGGFGPWLLTRDEIPDDAEMTLVTRLNGQEVQRASTRQMIHGIAGQIAYLSTIAPLCPGDVIVTGTPGGIGARRDPPLFMQPGDVVEVEVDRIGILRNTIITDT